MKVIVAVLVSTFVFGSALAQTPGPSASPTASTDSSGSALANSDAKRDAAVEKHIKMLHTTLKITPAEETLWAAVAQTMRDNANNLDTAMDKREDANGSAIDDLNTYGDVVQSHADGIKKLSAVFSTLYASMSNDQKRIADEVFAQREREGKKPVASN